MVPIPALWLPILVSAVFVFILSSLVHMVFGYHANDMKRLPNEEGVADALRKFSIPDGIYHMPRAGSMKEFGSPEHQDKIKKGPNAIITIWGGVNPSMTGPMVKWFLYAILVGVLAAYITSRAVAPDAHYLTIFRFAGTTSFIAYAMGGWQDTIWYRRPVSTSLKNTFDALLYALATAGAFGWLWPR
jgi:hypothetical protein